MPSVKEQLNQAAALLRGGDAEQAESICQSIIRRRPQHEEALKMLAMVRIQQRRWSDAEHCLRKVIRRNPKDAENLLQLGIVQSKSKQFDDAAASLRKAVELQPRQPRFYAALAPVLWSLQQHEEALAAARRAVDLAPRVSQAHMSLAEYEEGLAHFDRAADCYRRVLEISPKLEDAIGGLALALEREGEIAEAREVIQASRDQGTKNVRIRMSQARIARDREDRQEAVDQLEQCIAESEAIAPRTRVQAHYTLAHLWDALGEYDRAFAHATEANGLRGPASVAQRDSATDALMPLDEVERDGLTGIPHAEYRTERPIFILGMPRSGTSLLEQILSCHPEILGGGERRGVRQAVNTVHERLGAGRSVSSADPAQLVRALDEAARAYDEDLQSTAPDGQFVTDKMPGNFIHLGMIELLFPQAKIIHCTRHPLDTCVSCYLSNFGNQHDYTRALDALGQSYKFYYELMRIWRDCLTIPILEVSYEHVVQDMEAETRRVLDFCGVDWDDSCTRFHQSAHKVRTLSYDQVRQPIYNRSVGRYRNYEAHLGPLKESLGPDVPLEPAR